MTFTSKTLLAKIQVKKLGTIIDRFQPVKVARNFLYRTIKLFGDTGLVAGRPSSDRLRSARESYKNPGNALEKLKILLRKMNISMGHISRIIKFVFGLGAYKRLRSRKANKQSEVLPQKNIVHISTKLLLWRIEVLKFISILSFKKVVKP